MILVTGGNGLRRAPRRRMRCARRTARCAAWCATAARAGSLESWGCELADGRRDRRGQPAPRGRGLRRPSSTSWRSSPGGPRTSSASWSTARATSSRAAQTAGVAPLRAHERAGRRARDEGARALLRREVGDGAGRSQCRASSYAIFRPSFVFGPGRRRRCRFSPRMVRFLPVDPGRRRREAAHPADLGRRRRRVLRRARSHLPGAANRTFELGGPDT